MSMWETQNKNLIIKWEASYDVPGFLKIVVFTLSDKSQITFKII